MLIRTYNVVLCITVADMRREKIPNLKIEKDFLLSYIRCYRSVNIHYYFSFERGKLNH